MDNTVLIVDDDPDIRDVLRFLLAERGYEVQVAPSREAALLMSGDPPDVVLMDYSMPSMPADEFLVRLRMAAPYTQVILITASHNAEDKALELGLEHWVSKPFDLDQLVLKIKACCAGLHATRPATFK